MKYIALILFLCSTLCVAQAPDARRIQKHIKVLASDSMQGRSTGSDGERMAAAYIQSQFKTLSLKPSGDASTYLQKFEFKGGQHGEGPGGTANNVVGFLDNGGATTIIIGAHYDHLGLGMDGSSLDTSPKGKIHNGADDNASGVAGVLELARYFQSNNTKEKNNFLFICFSGEELGLHGSKHFADHPTIDMNNVSAMINLDMVGRLDASKGISVTGSGTSPVWEPLLKKLSTPELLIKTDSSGTGPSDHTSFYLKNIPVLHFFTGSHSDYHKPSDDWDKVNSDGEQKVLGIIIQVIESIDKEPKLAFLKTKSKMTSSRASFKVTLGIMPSYSSGDGGLKIDAVSEGKPAQKAGILAGDVIIQMGDLPIKDMDSYMGALGKFEKGQTVPVKVKRNGQEATVMVVF